MSPIERAILRQQLGRLGHNALKMLERELMPRCCVFCGVTANHDERFVCAGCHADLPWIKRSCPLCALQIPGDSDVLCASCQIHPPRVMAAIAPLEYAFPVDAAIKAVKFHRQLHYLPAFADILCEAAARLPADIDAILPVPLHRWRQARRGFNQARELAIPLHKKLSAPLLKDVVRNRATPPQSGLGALERASNMKTAFRVNGRITARHVLIVDDVVTTGATCHALTSLLQKHGVARISVLSLARASRPF